MPAPYSQDLRVRIIAHHEESGDGSILCGRLFRVGEATVRRLFALHRETNSVAPKHATGGVDPKISDDDLKLLKVDVEANNDLTMSEVRDNWAERTGTIVSTATMGRALKRAGLTLKKRPDAPRSGSVPTLSNGGPPSERSSIVPCLKR